MSKSIKYFLPSLQSSTLCLLLHSTLSLSFSIPFLTTLFPYSFIFAFSTLSIPDSYIFFPFSTLSISLALPFFCTDLSFSPHNFLSFRSSYSFLNYFFLSQLSFLPHNYLSFLNSLSFSVIFHSKFSFLS